MNRRGMSVNEEEVRRRSNYSFVFTFLLEKKMAKTKNKPT